MSILSVDFHTHILPGVDDGCPSVEEAICMLRTEYAQGVKKVFLTPHFDAQVDFPEDFFTRRSQAHDLLLDAIRENDLIPELALGAEVSFCPGMSAWEQLPDLALGDTRYILIEMPDYLWGNEEYLELRKIYKYRNLIPILAHIERYFLPFRTHAMLRKLAKLEVLLQFNCDFFIEKRTYRIARKFLSKGFVDVIGSDCHSATWRAPNVKQARDVIMRYSDDGNIMALNKKENLVFSSKISK